MILRVAALITLPSAIASRPSARDHHWFKLYHPHSRPLRTALNGVVRPWHALLPSSNPSVCYCSSRSTPVFIFVTERGQPSGLTRSTVPPRVGLVLLLPCENALAVLAMVLWLEPFRPHGYKSLSLLEGGSVASFLPSYHSYTPS